jgi:phage gp16-like protein
MSDRRRRDLAKIHIAKKQLGLDEDSYRAMLNMVAGVGSAADLDAEGRLAVLAHLRRIGFKAKRKSYPRHANKPDFNAVAVDKEALLRKIEAYLAEAKRPWNYAHGMARRMFKVDRVEWCRAGQLHKMVAALAYDARRHRRFTGASGS